MASKLSRYDIPTQSLRMWAYQNKKKKKRKKYKLTLHKA